MSKIEQANLDGFHQTVEVTDTPGTIIKSLHRQSFGVVDQKGREVGAVAKLYGVTYRDATPEELALKEGTLRERYEGPHISHIPAGSYWCFTPSVTRGGDDFGPSQNSKWYTNAADRDAAVTEYFASARKRAVKQFGA